LEQSDHDLGVDARVREDLDAGDEAGAEELDGHVMW
jgi:hypothetical protein